MKNLGKRRLSKMTQGQTILKEKTGIQIQSAW